MEKNRRNLIKRAIFSRILLIVLQFLGNILIPDHEANVFVYPKDVHSTNKTILDKATNTLLEGFVRWDAQYFMHLAINGYTYENTLAFFPLLPGICKIIVNILSYFTFDLLSIDSLTLLVYIVLNVFFFVQAALALYQLTGLIVNDKFAYKCAKLFCYNPASIFFTAPYTESLFAYLTFKTIENLLRFHYRNDKRYLMKAIFFIALSGVTRSNGILNVGFLIYYFSITTERITIQNAITLILSTIICLIPFVSFQFYCHSLFCNTFISHLPAKIISYAMVNGIILPGQNEIYQQTWCNYKLLPIPYSYVQDKYWNVGFFKYYQLKQIPNFLLALPIICLILLQSYYFFKYNWHYIVHHSMFVKFLLRNFGGNNYLRRQKYAVESKFEIDFAFPCILHALALTIFCIIFVHIQVTTRMLCSASPVIYWFSNQVNKRFIKYYYLCYFYVGTIMFCNFLPWT